MQVCAANIKSIFYLVTVTFTSIVIHIRLLTNTSPSAGEDLYLHFNFKPVFNFVTHSRKVIPVHISLLTNT